MAEHLPLSVHILTRNSAATLPRALESLPPAAELLVADGGSTDETRTIAEGAGARLLHQPTAGPITDFSAARSMLLQETTQPWVLVLDSDEELSPALREEIMAVIRNPATQPGAWWVPRRYRMPDGRIITHASTYPNARIYFFHRSVAERWIKPVHEKILLQPGTPIGWFHGWTIADLPTVAEFREKNLRYLRIEAQDAPSPSLLHWFRHRLLHTLRSRCIALIRLAWIWLLPHPGAVRLPLRHEALRFWYAWRLIVMTFPRSL